MSANAAPTAELTAICHILPMDEGLYCVSLGEPASPSFSSQNLPGVRLSLPPGPQSEHQGVTISTFRADGWLDTDRPAALVHVSKGPARVMLTIYQEASQPREAAPRLMITQLGQLLPIRSAHQAGGTLPVGAPSHDSMASAAPPGGAAFQGDAAPRRDATFPADGTFPARNPSQGSTPFQPGAAPQPGAAFPAGAVFPGAAAQSAASYQAGGRPGPAQASPVFPPPSAVATPSTSNPSIVTGFAAHGPSAAVSGQAALSPQALITAHVRNRGDMQARLTDWVGLPGSGLWIEGFGIGLPSGWTPGELQYQGIVGKSGPTPWLPAPEFCGSRGQTLPLLGFGLRLSGTAARLYDCTYRASFIDGSTTGPVSQGQICQSPGQAAVEAIQIVFTRKPA